MCNTHSRGTNQERLAQWTSTSDARRNRFSFGVWTVYSLLDVCNAESSCADRLSFALFSTRPGIVRSKIKYFSRLRLGAQSASISSATHPLTIPLLCARHSNPHNCDVPLIFSFPVCSLSGTRRSLRYLFRSRNDPVTLPRVVAIHLINATVYFILSKGLLNLSYEQLYNF